MYKSFFLLSLFGFIQKAEARKVNFQNLTFYNSEETIIFKERELININGLKYRYLGLIQSDTNIKAINLGLMNGKNVEMSVDNIFTFQKHKRFPFKSVYFGMIATSLINGLFGFSIGYSEGTDNFDGGPLPKGYDGLYGGTITGGFFALFGGIIYGVPLGFTYGLLTKKENELYYFYYHEQKGVYDYKLKFDYANKKH